MQYIEALHHVGLPTANMKATVEFYGSLGGKVVFEKDDVEAGQPIQVKHINFHGVLLECYERTETAQCPGAVDHLAFKVHDIDEMYALCKEKGFTLFEDCADAIGHSTYWPKGTRWFIVIGPNAEMIEFCTEG